MSERACCWSVSGVSNENRKTGGEIVIFRSELISKIVRGEKSQTRRLVKEGELKYYYLLDNIEIKKTNGDDKK